MWDRTEWSSSSSDSFLSMWLPPRVHEPCLSSRQVVDSAYLRMQPVSTSPTITPHRVVSHPVSAYGAWIVGLGITRDRYQRGEL